MTDHQNCELATALKAFYLAGGERYLLHEYTGVEPTLFFLRRLYDRIISGHYQGRFVEFTVPLTNVQKYNLLKAFPDTPAVFLEDIAGSKTGERCEQCFLFGLSDDLTVCRQCNAKALRVEVEGMTYSVHCGSCGYGVATTCIRPCMVNDTTPRDEFSKYNECMFRV